MDAGAGQHQRPAEVVLRDRSAAPVRRPRCSSPPRGSSETSVTRPLQMLTPSVAARKHPAEVGAVVAVAHRGRAGVDPGRVLAAFDRVALPGEGQQAGVDRVAGVAELPAALVREADVLDRRDRQRLLARGHPVAAQPGGGRLGFLDDRHRDRGPRPSRLITCDLGRDRRRLGAGADDQQVGLAGRFSSIGTRGPMRARGSASRPGGRPRFGDDQPALVGAEGDRAFPDPLVAVVGRRAGRRRRARSAAPASSPFRRSWRRGSGGRRRRTGSRCRCRAVVRGSARAGSGAVPGRCRSPRWIRWMQGATVVPAGSSWPPSPIGSSSLRTTTGTGGRSRSVSLITASR